MSRKFIVYCGTVKRAHIVTLILEIKVINTDVLWTGDITRCIVVSAFDKISLSYTGKLNPINLKLTSPLKSYHVTFEISKIGGQIPISSKL